MAIVLNDHVEKVVIQIEQLLRKKQFVNVAIDGNSGAGKSTMSAFLKRKFVANVFHMDDFFLRPEQRTEERTLEVGGNVDYERFKVDVLDQLHLGKPFSYQVYDCSVERLTSVIDVQPKRLNIVEGVYSMHPALRDAFDYKIFLTIDPATQIARLRQRNGVEMLQRFKNEWIPLENRYFSELNIADLADIVVVYN